MKHGGSPLQIKITLLGTPGKNMKEYRLTLDAELTGKQALEEIKRSVTEKGVEHHYQILVNGKFAHTEMKMDFSLRDGDEVKIVPVLGGG